MQSINQLTKTYNGIFPEKDKEDGEAGEEGTGKDINVTGKSFHAHWGWYCVLDGLSNNDRTKWDFFEKMNVIAFLNSVAFYKDKQDYQNEILKLNGSR